MNSKTIIVAAVAVVAGVAGGYWYARHTTMAPDAAAGVQGERKVLFYRNPMNPQITSPVPAKDEMGMDYIPVYADEQGSSGERKVLFYRNPMNPEITSPVPAKDEMGMDYIPVYADDAGGNSAPAGTVKIDPVTEQNIGVRTTRAKVQPLSHTIRTLGRVAYDEDGMARLHPRIEGWVEKVSVSETGEQVRAGDVLASIYSPQLVSTQQEFVLALDNFDALASSPFEDVSKGAKDMVDSARERLRLLDVPEGRIRQLEKDRKVRRLLEIRSPFDGIAANVGVREGQYVTPKDELYMLADISSVWVDVDIFESDLPWVNVGDPAEMEFKGIPGRTFEGTVSYIYPYMDNRTRTVKARLEFENPGDLLKPDMYADVTVKTDRQPDAVVIPSQAIVRSGVHPQVFVVRAPGKFEPRQVELGVSSQGLTQVLSGVSAGESVVTSAQFLIDSESKLREATAKMMEAAKSGGSVGHEGMDMSGDHSAHEGMDMDGMDMSGDHSAHQGMDMDGDHSRHQGMDMSGDHAQHQGMDMDGDHSRHQGMDMDGGHPTEATKKPGTVPGEDR